jgi:hypothetical protein
MTAKQVETAVMKLPKRDRVQILMKLLDTLPMKPGERNPDLIALWIAEAELRLELLRSGELSGVPAEQVFKRSGPSMR